ncbi:MAG: hypothetical protein WCL06_08580 [Bacteroidota bacterium]
MAIDEKQIKKLAQEKIKQGLTKQAIYEELHEEFHGGQKIANIIQSLPSAQASQRYKAWHMLFLVLLCVSVGLQMLSINFAGILWTVPMIVFAAMHKSRFYGWACIPGIYGLLLAAVVIAQIHSSRHPLTTVLFVILGISIFLVSGFITFLGFFLRSKLTPSYIESKEMYENREGHTRLRLVFTFRD